MSNHARPKRATLRALGGLALAGAALAPRTLLAQMGERAIRFILPVATGSGVDTITRAANAASTSPASSGSSSVICFGDSRIVRSP